MREIIERFLSLTGSEKRAIFVLIMVAILVIIVPAFYLHYYFPSNSVTPQPEYSQEIIAFENEWKQKKLLAHLEDSLKQDSSRFEFNPYATVDISPRFAYKPKPPTEYFYFDPNKIGVAEWQKLGFSEKQAGAIENAKAKGFKFYKPEDLKKIYVVGEENYPRLAPYIKIEKSPKPVYTQTIYPEKPNAIFVVDINTADSSLFERQNGIGPSLASRIIKYRNRLGGFIAISQLKEVWNFPDSTYQKLKDRFVLNEPTFNKININTADFKTMGTHPYINYTYARIIEAYRKEHGDFSAPSDLHKITAIPDSIYQRMLPYISVQ